MVGVMNKAVGEFLFCGGFGWWEALGLYGGDLWQIIYGCSSDYHDIVSSNLLSINFFLSTSQLISFSVLLWKGINSISMIPINMHTSMISADNPVKELRRRRFSLTYRRFQES